MAKRILESKPESRRGKAQTEKSARCKERFKERKAKRWRQKANNR